MKETSKDIYRCPACHSKLVLAIKKQSQGVVSEGEFKCSAKHTFSIKDGIPDFTIYGEIKKNEYALTLFKDKAKGYDKYQHLSFETFYQAETTVRNSMIDRLHLKANSKVLEVNAGTGRDSVLIAKRLSKKGLFHAQDISREMLDFCKDKLKNTEVSAEIHQGNASKLPYADKLFDAVYSFGGVGMNTYSKNKEAIAEMLRVTKTGGRIVFGGLSLAPWLRDTFFGKVLVNHNEHYANEITFTDFPIEARNLNISWILEGAGFVIDFSVGEGEPGANFNYEIPGPRGGTHLTRYLGALEGVTPETKKLAQKAREKLGISMHKWLDELVKREAEKVLKNKKA
jgi:ubiquinone/menaquinone biosynthesis C-methylase UbiE/uncharacterized protein YbaR (Trm112 family)